MGEEISGSYSTRDHQQAYREKVSQCLDVFDQMLRSGHFDFCDRTIGLELEFNLVDDGFQPSLTNAAVLAALDDASFQTELAMFNIEYNAPPTRLDGRQIDSLENRLQSVLTKANSCSGSVGARLVMIGTLPTLMAEHFDSSWMSQSLRYAALNDSIFSARGEDLWIDIHGAEEHLSMYADSIGPESACTSTQLHVQVPPLEFAHYWNASQVLSGAQVALAANSPFLFGRRLWAETRIELFKHATDTRPLELRNQGVRPRVFFGDRWITSIFDLFEENVRYFRPLLPELSDEDPSAVFENGGAPSLSEMKLHNGTVYRWNRPIYDVADGVPHVRLENRVLPAGPTVVDTVANAVFYFGAVRYFAESSRPISSRLPIEIAESDFLRCARDGLTAQVNWPGVGTVVVSELIVKRLVPAAAKGLRAWGVDDDIAEYYLNIVSERAMAGRNGAHWQAQTVKALQDSGQTRAAALTSMLEQYCHHMKSNVPVHCWPL